MNICDKYFLTKDQKQIELVKLNKFLANGNIDAEMIPWLDKINALPGLVSQFCCAGHDGPDANGIDRGIHNGQGNLLVRMSQEAFTKLFLCENLNKNSNIIQSYCDLNFIQIAGDKWCRFNVRYHFTTRDLILGRVFTALEEKLNENPVEQHSA